MAYQAELSTSVIYTYFEGKDDLFGYVYKKIYLVLLDYIKPASIKTGSVEDRLVQIAKSYIQFDQKYPNESGLISKNLNKLNLPDDLRKKLQALSLRALTYVADIIDDGIKEGFFPKGLNKWEAAFHCYSGIEGILYTLDYGQYPHLDLKADRLAKQHIYYLIKGLQQS